MTLGGLLVGACGGARVDGGAQGLATVHEEPAVVAAPPPRALLSYVSPRATLVARVDAGALRGSVLASVVRAFTDRLAEDALGGAPGRDAQEVAARRALFDAVDEVVMAVVPADPAGRDAGAVLARGRMSRAWVERVYGALFAGRAPSPGRWLRVGGREAHALGDQETAVELEPGAWLFVERLALAEALVAELPAGTAPLPAAVLPFARPDTFRGPPVAVAGAAGEARRELGAFGGGLEALVGGRLTIAVGEIVHAEALGRFSDGVEADRSAGTLRGLASLADALAGTPELAALLRRVSVRTDGADVVVELPVPAAEVAALAGRVLGPAAEVAAP